MTVLIVLRFIMGVGLGAENVVGYSTMTEFVPARSRGRFLGLMAVFVVTGLPAASLLGYARHPGLRLAGDVRPRRSRCACGLVRAQEPAGIAALARSRRARTPRPRR